ncbi:hypothetical protein EON65_27660 [archaeon]|nr:MAG: hypothetical protein EON65_27660 [archaeon]
MFTDGMLQMFPMPAELLKGRSSKASSCTRGMVNQEDSMLVSVQAGNVEVTSAGHKSHKAASLNEQDGVMHETESYFDVLIE